MVQSNYTIELDKHLVAAKRRQAIGVLQSDLLPGVPLSMSANEKEAFYGFLGVYEALHEKLGTLLNGNFAPDFKRQFQDLYAANVAAQYAARRCVPVLSGGQPAAGQEGTRYAVTGFGKGAADDRRERLFASPFKEYLSRPRPDESLALGGLFSSYLRASESVASDPRFADARSVAGAFSVVIDGEAYAAFRSAGLEGAIAAQLPPAEERVVGNVEMMSGLRSALYALAHFDGNTNPFKRRVRLPKTVSIQGDPGTGKTIGIRQSIADAQRDFGPQMSVPLKTVALTNAIKSSYFAKSAENVRSLFREVRETKAAYVIVADDIESIIHDRRSVGNNVEEANVTQTLLNELEGLFSVDKGNYFSSRRRTISCASTPRSTTA